MSLFRVDPGEQLVFQECSGDGRLTQRIRVTNTGRETLAFKIRTTAPDDYTVKPNMGVVGPGESREIEIVLRPRKDKFLVIGTNTASTESVTPEFWAMVENSQDRIVEKKKLKCVFGTTATTDQDPQLFDAQKKIGELESIIAELRQGAGNELWGVNPNVVVVLAAVLAFILAKWVV